MILPIHLYGASIWNAPAQKVNRFDERTVGLIHDMFDTMRHADGIGLSAPQVGMNISLAVIDTSGMEGHATDGPLVVINAEILSSSEEETTMEEGCLSIPGIHEEVRRPESVIVRYVDGNFEPVEIEYSGVLSRVFQHEYDHSHRKFFTDRVSMLRRQLLKPRLSAIKGGNVTARYPVVSASGRLPVRRTLSAGKEPDTRKIEL